MATEAAISGELMVGAAYDCQDLQSPSAMVSTRAAAYVGTSGEWTTEMAALFGVLGGATTQSGKVVSTRAALTYSPVWAAVDILSSDVSKLPFLTYEWNSDFTERKFARNHPTWVRMRRNTGEMTSNLWLGMMMTQALLHGRAHSVIHREDNGYWLEFLTASQVQPDRVDGERIYRISRNPYSSLRDLPPYEIKIDREMFNINGLTLDFAGGLSLISFARNTIGRMLSAEEYTDDFFSNDGVTSGVLTTPNKLSEPEMDLIMRLWEAVHTKGGRRHRVVPLGGGMDFKRTAVSPGDALLVDNLNLGVKDVARFFKIPGFKLGDDSQRSYRSNEIEQQAYLNHTLMSWLVKFEEESGDKLFSDSERKSERFETEFDVSQLLRADFKTRKDANAKAIQTGQKSANEARREDKLAPYDGGDVFWMPVNLQATPTTDGGGEPDPTAADDNGIRSAHREVLTRSLEGMVQRIITSVRRALTPDEDLFAEIKTLDAKHGDVTRQHIDAALTVARAQYPAEQFETDRICKLLMIQCRKRITEGADRGANPEQIRSELKVDAAVIATGVFPNSGGKKNA